MNIAAWSSNMKQLSLINQVGISIAKKAMDTALENSQALTKMMEQSVAPNLGSKLDIKV